LVSLTPFPFCPFLSLFFLFFLVEKQQQQQKKQKTNRDIGQREQHALGANGEAEATALQHLHAERAVVADSHRELFAINCILTQLAWHSVPLITCDSAWLATRHVGLSRPAETNLDRTTGARLSVGPSRTYTRKKKKNKKGKKRKNNERIDRGADKKPAHEN
jgi:hypothetical protein